MRSNSLHLIIRSRLRPLLLLLILIAHQCWAIPPAQAEANTAPFRIMVPLMLMSSTASAPEATIEEQVLTLTNTLRQQHGCPALQLSPELSNAARSHSQDMAA